MVGPSICPMSADGYSSATRAGAQDNSDKQSLLPFCYTHKDPMSDHQLAKHRGLHRPAVWTVFQRWERLEQEEHPRQQSPLLPVLHLPVQPRVRWDLSPSGAGDCLSVHACLRVLQPPTSGRGVYEGPAWKSQYSSCVGQSWLHDTCRGVLKEAEGWSEIWADTTFSHLAFDVT